MALEKVLIANRGEIAVRIARACRAEGIDTVIVYSDADRRMPYLRDAGRAVCIGPASASASYLNADAILATALGTGCDGVHPGYGFLAENADFADACTRHDLVFVGPHGDAIRAMGDKIHGRNTAVATGVPVVPGHDADLTDHDACVRAAAEVGYPLLVKASAGGGGRGMRVVQAEDGLADALTAARAEASAAFGDPRVYLERYFQRVHHVEVQIFGDAHGHVVHLGERECSVQRRHQKLVEESPSPVIGAATREAMCAAAVTLARTIGYRSAGTVEFIVEPETGAFHFIEMNTRIQVEHPVTEAVYGVDLVREQLKVAGGAPLGDDVVRAAPEGHAIEWRITAEDPARDFLPVPGVITAFRPPAGAGIRVDTFVEPGHALSPHYDSLLAKLVVHGSSREEAIARSAAALEDFHVDGVPTPIAFLRALANAADFRAGRVHTRWVETQGGTLV